MNADEAIQNCQAYLDEQLDPAVAREVEACLARDPDAARYFDEQRSFHLLVRNCSESVDAPADLQPKLKQRLMEAAASERQTPASFAVSPRLRQNWYLWAAALLLICGGGLTWAMLSNPQCPYIISCTKEHDMVSQGRYQVQTVATDALSIQRFVSGQVGSTTSVPVLVERSLKPVGAGKVDFKDLKQYGAPDAAFVKYEGPKKESLTLLVHPWPEETPMEMNLGKYKGKDFWAASHHGSSVACWKADDGKLLYSLVSSTHSKSDVLEIAKQMRDSLAARVN